MSKVRLVKRIVEGVPATDGAGVKLVRLFGGEEQAKEFDPFLMMDGFDSTDPSDYVNGFPWHPHRGIETITYLISGRLEHRDSLGSIGTINDGDVQWMTAGSGIVHQEMPQATKHMLGIQLWLNLPSKHKMTTPQYGDILARDIPVVEEGENIVRVIAGDYGKTQGAFAGKYVAPLFLDVSLAADKDWQLPTPSAHALFVYIVHGSVQFGNDSPETTQKNVVLFEEGDLLKAKAGSEGARLLVFCAKPLREPVAWGGPVVMNTRPELIKAFEEIQDGSFVKTDIDTKP